MKNVDDFVRDWPWVWPKTLHGQLKFYNDYNRLINHNLSEKQGYIKLLSDESIDSNYQLSFKEQWELYSIINNLIRKNFANSDNPTYLGIDLINLRQRLESVYKDVHNYERVKSELKAYKNETRKILTEYISFDTFYSDYPNDRCIYRHYFVRLEDELKCMCCGATTKDYPLSEEELDFLTLCADYQGILLKEASLDDLPLLQVIMERQDYYRRFRIPIDSVDEDIEDIEDYLTEAEEQCIEDESDFFELKQQIRKAHLLDSDLQTYDRGDLKVRDLKYLSYEKPNELLSEIEKDMKIIEETDSKFKDLMLEECKTTKYEILIESGAHIPTLLKQAQSVDDIVALTKAYYNIFNKRFKDRSLDCITASPEINNRILQMKIGR